MDIQRLENVTADRRELYNDSVARYNTRIHQVPAVILAGPCCWTSSDFFAVRDAQRAPATVDLSDA